MESLMTVRASQRVSQSKPRRQPNEVQMTFGYLASVHVILVTFTAIRKMNLKDPKSSPVYSEVKSNWLRRPVALDEKPRKLPKQVPSISTASPENIQTSDPWHKFIMRLLQAQWNSEDYATSLLFE